MCPPSVERVDAEETIKLRWVVNEDQVQCYYIETNCIGSTSGWTRITKSKIIDKHYNINSLKIGEWYKFRVVVMKNDTEFVGEESETIQAIGEFSLKLTYKLMIKFICHFIHLVKCETGR